MDMEKKQLTYTTIIHSARNKLKLTNNEYVFCDTIYHLSNNPEYNYCMMSKKKLGEIVGVSEQSIHKLINKMIDLGLIEKEETFKGLKTTKKWYDNAILTDGSINFSDSKESLLPESIKFTPTLKKVYSHTKESLHNNNNNINNNIDNNMYNKNKKYYFRGNRCRIDNFSGKWKCFENGEWLEIADGYEKEIIEK